MMIAVAPPPSVDLYARALRYAPVTTARGDREAPSSASTQLFAVAPIESSRTSDGQTLIGLGDTTWIIFLYAGSGKAPDSPEDDLFTAKSHIPAARTAEGADLPRDSADSTADAALTHVDVLRQIKQATELPDDRIAKLIGVSRQTLHKWEKGQPISDAHRQHLLSVYDVLKRATRRHPLPSQIATWLDMPRGIDARTPAELLAAGEFDRARYLAVAVPSPKMKPPPAWVRRPVAEAFRAGAERWRGALPPEEDLDPPPGSHEPWYTSDHEAERTESA